MMIQEVSYNGYTAVPSDRNSNDGDLSAAINLVPEYGGELKPVLQPHVISNMPLGYRLYYIHKTTNYTHYIVLYEGKNESKLYYAVNIDELYNVNKYGQIIFTDDVTLQISDIKSIGNTLIISNSSSIIYCLWKDNSYTYLGDHIPELPLSFSLVGEPKKSETLTINMLVDGDGLDWSSWKPNESGSKVIQKDSDMKRTIISRMTEEILGKVNLFVNENSIHPGKFIFPFFVRYAYRLYDGTLTMHSSPVLMITSSWLSPQAFITSWFSTDSSHITSIYYEIAAMLYKLQFRVTDSTNRDTLLDWTDIVKSVDVFISAPIYTYKQSGEVNGWMREPENKKGYSLSMLDIDYSHTLDYPTDSQGKYYKYYVTRCLVGVNGFDASDYGTLSGQAVLGFDEFLLPRYSDDEVKTAIRDCNLFYLLKSFKLSDLPVGNDDETARQDINLPEDFMNSLTSREVMTDDYDSHDSIYSSFMMIYNSRLHLSNVTKKLSTPNSPQGYVGFTNECWKIDSGYGSINFTHYGKSEYKIYVFIKDDNKDIVVSYTKSSCNVLGNSFYLPFVYFYYPNANAYKVVIEAVNDSGNTYYELPLERHDFLNGAFFFAGWNPTYATISQSPVESQDRTVHLPNKLYVSEVNNPFIFPVTGINTIGAGEIVGIGSANKPLSQGQFGQFPLYAFCTDGVWALIVNDNGGYSAVQPITRDVCSNSKSITSTDSEVLFATERGIMLMSGSTATCITDSIFEQHPYDITNIPHVTELQSMLTRNGTDTCLPIRPFLEFLKNCRMLYDYIHQHIIFFNASYTYAYVFSIKSKQWGTIYSKLREPINSYPDSMAMTNENKLVTFSSSDDADAQCLFVTRPIKLGQPDILKTVTTIIQRGYFNRGDVLTVLYGSRDLQHWYVISSSLDHRLHGMHGTPYKYFRIASVSTLSSEKSISGATFEFMPRQINRIR